MSDHGSLVQFVLRHLQIKIGTCSRQKHEDGYSLPKRTVPDYNLIFVTRGRPVWVMADEPIPLEPGRLLIVPPDVWHHAYCRTRRVTIGSIHLEASLPGGQDAFDLLRPARTIDFARDTPLQRYLHGALTEFDRGSFVDTRMMLVGWGRLITLELLRQAHEQSLLRPRPIDPVVAQVLDHLVQRVGSRMSLDELAEFAGYSPQYLNRVFRRLLGVTPLQYLARLRMDRAASLLIEGRLTVKAIAEAVGYEDPYFFSRVFKQHFGRSPAQYRDSALPTSSAGP